MKASTRKQLSRLVDLGFSDPHIFALVLKCPGMCSHLKSFVDRYDTVSVTTNGKIGIKKFVDL